MNPYVQKNQELWDEWTEINVRSAFYDVAGFKKQPAPLDDVVREALGDLAGKSVLHLQCHFGMDTLRIALDAQRAVGVDLSEKAIAAARGLATELGSSAQFVQSDLYALDQVLDEQFDVVFTSHGAIEWLPDLAPWGRLIARYLKPGGRFAIVDGHPTALIFDGAGGELAIKYPYFGGDAPIEVPPSIGNYADPEAVVTKAGYSFPHAMSETVMALVNAGLRIDDLQEHRHVVWQMLPFLVEDAHAGIHGQRAWRMPDDKPQLPLMFSIRASKPA